MLGVDVKPGDDFYLVAYQVQDATGAERSVLHTEASGELLEAFVAKLKADAAEANGTGLVGKPRAYRYTCDPWTLFDA